MKSLTIYTIGHSNHPWPKFVELITGARIRCLIDVRTNPRSRFAQFNRAPLESRLRDFGIEYHHMGTILGGRRAGDGALDYESTAATDSFRRALQEVEGIARQQPTVLMCSEHEPLDCHRFLLIARHLAEGGADMRHLLRDGSVEPHCQTEERLLKKTGADVGPISLRPQALAYAFLKREQALRRTAGK
jgi:uncharacterized protein (DUF488 family)